MRVPLRVPLLLLLLAGALSSCGKSASVATNPAAASSSAEQTQIVGELSQQPEVMEDGIADSEDPVTLDSPSGLAAIHPLTYHREIKSRERSFEFAFSDSDSTGRPTRAVVTVTTRLRGVLHILAGVPGSDGTPIDSTTKRVNKPFVDIRTRRILLLRVCTSDDSRVRWRIAATSGAVVSSRPHTTHILSLRVQAADLDTTITEPLAFFRLRHVLKLPAGTDVTLTVTTERNDDVVVLHHALRRFRLHNNGDNTYTEVWGSRVFERGVRHFGVNALSNGTLFDDALPYDSQSWILPFAIAPETMPEML